MRVFEIAENRISSVSSTTRFAPTWSISAPSRRKRPSRLNSPVSGVVVRLAPIVTINNSFRVMRDRTSNPRECVFAATSEACSSNATNTPRSPWSWAPRTRNSMPRIVLPVPVPPHTSVVRPRGRPPLVISSSPRMPVGHLGGALVGMADALDVLGTVLPRCCAWRPPPGRAPNAVICSMDQRQSGCLLGNNVVRDQPLDVRVQRLHPRLRAGLERGWDLIGPAFPD
jgi:hypothetical protein